MAWMNQERKRPIEAAVKAICKRYGVKCSLSVRDRSTLVLKIPSGSIDFFAERVRDRWSDERLAQSADAGYLDVNPYSVREAYTGRAREFLVEVLGALNAGNHDNSDAMTDYFDVGWYVSVRVGEWDKPYVLTQAAA